MTQMIQVNVGFGREEIEDTGHFYDQDVVFARVSFSTRCR